MTDSPAIADEELYARLRAGDQGAMEELVRRYHAPLLAFIYRQTGDRHLAEDLAQEVFTRLVTYTGPLPQRFRGWAFTITANLVRDYFRSGYYRRERANPLNEPTNATPSDDPATTAEARVQQARDRSEVVGALQQLNRQQREVLVLRFYHDLKLEEIAEATHTPVGTVKSRLFHALKRMKTLLSGQPEPHEGHDATYNQRFIG
jgi:RNA polymerase sigma-70 factor (ECF subfamily)